MPAADRPSVPILPGDGIGPEVVGAALSVLDAAGAGARWQVHQVGQRAWEATGDALPAAVVDAVRRAGVALKGPVATPVGAPFRSVNVGLRRALGLYAQVRPARTWAGVPSRYREVDLDVIRETTEDLYRGIEFAPGAAETAELLGWLGRHGHDVAAGSGISIKPVSAPAARRCIALALDHARRTGRRRVTVVHKASVMRHTDGVFLAEGLRAAREHPDVEVDALAVDAAAAELVRRPEAFEVLVTLNSYGDVLSDLAAALVGGVGLVPGVNVGDGVAVFEAAHGTAPRHAGQDRANPVALVLSGAMLLEHLGQPEPAARVRSAVAAVLREGTDVTYDLRAAGDPRPPVGTRRMAEAIIDRLE